MSETEQEISWKSPLDGHVTAGRFGNPDVPLPGIVLNVVTGRDVVRVSPFRDKRTSASAALRKLAKIALPAVGKSTVKQDYTVAWFALDAWIIMMRGEGRGGLAGKLQKSMRTSAAVVDQSHGVTAISVSGHKCRALLAKGCAIDLDPAMFPVGACAATQMEHVGVHLRRCGEDEYEILAPTSMVASLWHFLTEMALEFGYDAGPR